MSLAWSEVALVEANGLRLAYDAVGEGEPLLLIMGFGAQLIYWPEELCEALAGRGFRVIRFDNRDVGLSSKLEGRRAPGLPELLWGRLVGRAPTVPYTLADMADDTAGLLEALGLDRAHVVGASMGGMIAQTLAIRHPARVRSLVSIMSHPGEHRHHLLTSPLALRALLRPAPRSREEAMDRAEALFRVIGSPGYPFDRERVRDGARRAYERAFYPPGVFRQFAAILASPGRTRALGQLRIPAGVIHGSADRLISPLGGRDTAQAIPGAHLRIIPGMGHDLPPGVWPEIVDLIERVARGSTA